MVAPNRRGGSGRKKTVIRRIEQKDARHVCYSKRRVGFFNKASDLAVLTGAEVAALAFSPGGNVFSFGHPSIDSVVERFLAGQGAGAGARVEGAAQDRLLAGEGAGEGTGEGAGAGAGEGAAGEDKKLEKLHQEFDELGTELVEVKRRAERKEEAMAKERAAGDQIAAWFDRNVADMGDEDMAAFFAALMQVKEVVSHRANHVLLEAMHVNVSRMAEVALSPPPQIFGGSTFEFGSSSSSADGMEFQFLVPPPQEQGFEAGMDMQQMVMAALLPSQVVAAGMDIQQQMVMELPSAQWVDAWIDMQQQVVMELPPSEGVAAGFNMQQQMVMELPPAQGVAAGMDMQEMPPPPGFAAGMDMDQRQMAIPQPPGLDDDMWMEIQELLMAMPPSP